MTELRQDHPTGGTTSFDFEVIELGRNDAEVDNRVVEDQQDDEVDCVYGGSIASLSGSTVPAS